MNAIRYYRLKHQLTQEGLAKKVGVSKGTISKYERAARPSGGRGHNYNAISRFFRVPMNELLESKEDTTHRNQVQTIRESRTENMKNCITVYRHAHGLTFKALASLLDRTSRECARQACERDVPVKEHINTLAAHEGISVEEFIAKYSYNGDDAI